MMIEWWSSDVDQEYLIKFDQQGSQKLKRIHIAVILYSYVSWESKLSALSFYMP